MIQYNYKKFFYSLGISLTMIFASLEAMESNQNTSQDPIKHYNDLCVDKKYRDAANFFKILNVEDKGYIIAELPYTGKYGLLILLRNLNTEEKADVIKISDKLADKKWLENIEKDFPEAFKIFLQHKIKIEFDDLYGKETLLDLFDKVKEKDSLLQSLPPEQQDKLNNLIKIQQTINDFHNLKESEKTKFFEKSTPEIRKAIIQDTKPWHHQTIFEGLANKKLLLEELNDDQLLLLFDRLNGTTDQQQLLLDNLSEGKKALIEHHKIANNFDNEKDKIQFFTNASSEVKKAIIKKIHPIILGKSLFKPLTDKKVLLQEMTADQAKDLFDILSPQSSRLFLEALPQNLQQNFEKEIQNAHNIMTKYNTWQNVNYSVNCMWIYRSPEPDHEYIFPNNKQENFFKKISEWANINDKVNIWYDGNLASPKQIQNTQKYLNDKGLNVKINLKNIRDLAYVQQSPEVFSANKIGGNTYESYLPVYFRVDLARAIAALETVKTGEKFVYFDMDMEPMSKEKLFDPDTLYNLEHFGIVMAHYGALGFENGFQIVSDQVPELLKAMDFAIINLNIARAKNALQHGFFPNVANIDDGMKPLQQIVYNSYPDMFNLSYLYQGLLSLKFNGHSYDKNQDGFEPLRPFYKNGSLEVKDIKPFIQMRKGTLIYPTKEVDLPPTRMQYN